MTRFSTPPAATAELARRLGRAAGVPGLRIDRLYRDRELRPLELTVNRFNPDRCSGRLLLRRVDPADPGPGSR